AARLLASRRRRQRSLAWMHRRIPVTASKPNTSRNATVLVYNAQTVTPLTQQMKSEAAAHGIPIVAVTETIQPSNVRFQDWMYAELLQLENALNPALGQ